MKMFYERKGVFANENTVKDIDEKQGIVTGYFAVFGNKDSDEDVIVPGAFKKTLSENYRRIKHLYQHDPWRPLAGVKNERLAVKEDNYGLYFESKISQTSWGKDAIQLYVDGVVDEQSVGFKTIKSNAKQDYRELTELKLYEGSMVTWAANELAQTTGVKSKFTVESLTTKMDNIIKALRNGKYENEDIFDQLELYFKQLQQLFTDLTTKPDPVDSTLPESKNDLLDVFDTYTNNLKQAKDGNKRIRAEA